MPTNHYREKRKSRSWESSFCWCVSWWWMIPGTKEMCSIFYHLVLVMVTENELNRRELLLPNKSARFTVAVFQMIEFDLSSPAKLSEPALKLCSSLLFSSANVSAKLANKLAACLLGDCYVNSCDMDAFLAQYRVLSFYWLLHLGGLLLKEFNNFFPVC